MKTPRTQIVKSNYSQIPKEFVPLVSEALSFEAAVWLRTAFGVKKHIKQVKLISPNGVFLSGFEEKVSRLTSLTFPKRKKLDAQPLALNGIQLNNPQKRLVEAAITNDRGILLAPTGMGKTVIAAAIVSVFRKYKSLFLCHKIGLLEQAADEFEKLLNIKPQILGGGDVIKSISNICVATIQTAINHVEYLKNFDVIIVDEAHHCCKMGSQYWNFLLSSSASKRFGLTATLPKDKGRALIIEGLLGAVIGEITYEEGRIQGRLADVKVIVVPIKSEPPEGLNYRQIYKYLKTNPERNQKILDIVERNQVQGKSCLIMVKEIDHGEILFNMISKKHHCFFVSGSNKKKMRLYCKKCLNEKKAIVIATNIFDEGINIPSLDSIIIASGGKSEISVVQKVGRGTRKTEKKDMVEIYDFHDKGKYLEKHSLERLSVYKSMGWLC